MLALHTVLVKHLIQVRTQTLHVGVTYAAEDLTVMANYIKNKGNNTTNDSLGENEKQAVGAKYTMGDIKLAGYYIKGESTSTAGVETEA